MLSSSHTKRLDRGYFSFYMDGFNALVDVHITGIKVENGSVECRTSDGHVWVWNFASVGDPPEIQSNPNALIGTPASITNLWLFGADPGRAHRRVEYSLRDKRYTRKHHNGLTKQRAREYSQWYNNYTF